MQEIQKSRRPYTGKIKRRPISRKSPKTGDSNITEPREAEYRSASEKTPEPVKPTISDFKEIVPVLAENKPIFEINSESKIWRMSNTRLLHAGCLEAGKYITNEFQGIKNTVATPLGGDYTINTLEKIVLKEKANSWMTYSYFRFEDGKTVCISTDEQLEPGKDSKDAAFSLAEHVIGQLLFIDSKVNPDNRLLERTILVDQKSLVIVSSKLINLCKEEIDKDPEYCREQVNTIFQEISNKLGGRITQENVHSIAPLDGGRFFKAAHMAVVLGIRRWPFE